MIKYLATASLLLAAAYLTGGPALAADQGITDTEIVIGDVEPLTGPPALLGVAASIGHKIAIAEANAAGGINGRKIKYVLEDDGYVTARTIQGVARSSTSTRPLRCSGSQARASRSPSCRCWKRPAFRP